MLFFSPRPFGPPPLVNAGGKRTDSHGPIGARNDRKNTVVFRDYGIFVMANLQHLAAIDGQTELAAQHFRRTAAHHHTARKMSKYSYMVQMLSSTCRFSEIFFSSGSTFNVVPVTA